MNTYCWLYYFSIVCNKINKVLKVCCIVNTVTLCLKHLQNTNRIQHTLTTLRSTHTCLCVYSNDFLKTFASRSEKFLQKVAVNLMLWLPKKRQIGEEVVRFLSSQIIVLHITANHIHKPSKQLWEMLWMSVRWDNQRATHNSAPVPTILHMPWETSLKRATMFRKEQFDEQVKDLQTVQKHHNCKPFHENFFFFACIISAYSKKGCLT